MRVAVEPRHPSWWTEEVRGVLEGHGAALCWADRLGRPVTPLWRTAGFRYLRLHGGAARPRPRGPAGSPVPATPMCTSTTIRAAPPSATRSATKNRHKT
ncbi:DUF72 domain-containing protein [Actinomadura rubrisoli]|uniref:DUF72 domain-containing protein n=1 Tax=Actinomadura rubrisoli TaxID=2530368 RepID=UPI00244367FC|nr:DUF72 domain-containing protein [Actinomadura rubrisoli]